MPSFIDPFYATILVLVVTNERIVLAADSRKTYLDKTGVHKTGTIDKIYQTGDYYYAITGFHEEEEKFSIYRILHNILMQLTDIHEAVKQIANSLANDLKQYFTGLKKESPAVFDHFKKYSSSGGELFIITHVNNIPTAYLVDYHIGDGVVLKVTVNTWFITTNAIKNKDACFWRAIGNTGTLSMSFLSEMEWAHDPVKKAILVIEKGANEYPAFVSKPINIIELSKSGVQWILKTPTSPNLVILN